MALKSFTIPEEYITTVYEHREWSMYSEVPAEELTQEQLLKIIRGQDRIKTTGSREHPEFQALREKLGELGYIRIVRSVWNGDVVLKSFTLNEFKFLKGGQFLSPDALRNRMDYARKIGRKTLNG